MAPLPEATVVTVSDASTAAFGIIPGVSEATTFVLLALLILIFLAVWVWVFVSYSPLCLSRYAEREGQSHSVTATRSLWAALLSVISPSASSYFVKKNEVRKAADANASSKEAQLSFDVESCQRSDLMPFPAASTTHNTANVGSISVMKEAQLCSNAERKEHDKSSPLISSLVILPECRTLPAVGSPSMLVAITPNASPPAVSPSQAMPSSILPGEDATLTPLSSQSSHLRNDLSVAQDAETVNANINPDVAESKSGFSLRHYHTSPKMEHTNNDMDATDVIVTSTSILPRSTTSNETLSASNENLDAKCHKISTCHDDADCGVIVPSASSLSESISWDPELSQSVQCLGLWIEQQRAAKHSKRSSSEYEKPTSLGFQMLYIYDSAAKCALEATGAYDDEPAQEYSKFPLQASYDTLPTIKLNMGHNNTFDSLSTDSINTNEEFVPRDKAISVLVNHLYTGEPTWSSAARTFGPVIVVDECESVTDSSVSDDSTCYSPATSDGTTYLSPSCCY